MGERSRELFQKACVLIPGGVNSPVRACRNVDSTPLFIHKASGSHLWDVDGREYIDYVLSWGPMLLGHANLEVERELQEAAKRGVSFGAPSPGEVYLAEKVIDALPAVEMVRMVNSGTEAAMSALRLARAVTGRKKFLKFTGCYHGHADAFLVAAGSGVATLAIHGSPGVPDAVVADTLLAPYNDAEAATEVFEKYGEEIAAVIVEPVAANMGLVPPVSGFLEQLRKLASKYDALLVFDEVITGFRLSYGGAQARMGIDPDLTTLGKIIGGGLPVGAFGGKRRYMEHVAPAGEVYQAGTLSGNPLAMAAGCATLDRLRHCDYDALEKRVGEFAGELEGVLKRKGVPVTIPTIASMFTVFFNDRKVENFEDAKTCDQKIFASFYKQMREQGIYWPPSPFETCMTSFAHSEEDFARTLQAAEKLVF